MNNIDYLWVYGNGVVWSGYRGGEPRDSKTRSPAFVGVTTGRNFIPACVPRITDRSCDCSNDILPEMTHPAKHRATSAALQSSEEETRVDREWPTVSPRVFGVGLQSIGCPYVGRKRGLPCSPVIAPLPRCGAEYTGSPTNSPTGRHPRRYDWGIVKLGVVPTK